MFSWKLLVPALYPPLAAAEAALSADTYKAASQQEDVRSGVLARERSDPTESPHTVRNRRRTDPGTALERLNKGRRGAKHWGDQGEEGTLEE